MCTRGSSSMHFTESRSMLRPVKCTTRSNIREDTKMNMLLRAKKLSLGADSLMKSLQEKYEFKEPKPPLVLGLGIKRYKGTNSAFGKPRRTSFDERSDDTTATSEESAGIRCHSNRQDQDAEQYETNDDKDALDVVMTEQFQKQEIDAQNEVENRLLEIEIETQDILTSMTKDELVLDLSEDEVSVSDVIHAHEAVFTGNISALKQFLHKGYNVNDRDENGQTALEVAVSAGQTMALKLMVAHGGDVNTIDIQGRSLLHNAILGGHKKMVAMLLAAGAKSDYRDQRRGRTAVHVATLEGELVMLNLLVQTLKEDPWRAVPQLSITDKDGRTPLHTAASRGFVEAARLLLGAGYSVTKKDMFGLTPMHAALGLNHANKRCRLMLRLLLEAGGDLAIKEEHPEDGEDQQSGKQIRGEDIDEIQTMTSMSEAETDLATEVTVTHNDGVSPSNMDTMQRKHSKSSVICRRKCSGGWVNEEVDHVERMIHMAARVGCSGCLALLIEYGAPVNSRDRRDCTPLHLAAETNRPDAVRTLIRLGADVDATDLRGRTPLHLAISSDSPASVEVLLKLGADPYFKDEMGRSYAEHALFTRKLKAFQCLVRLGVCDVAVEGSTILHSSAALGCITSMQFLLSLGWECDVLDKDGLTPLHAAIGQGHEDMATLMITEGASILKRDKKGATPLHYAVRWGGSDALLRLLVKKGASLSARDRLGRTPLHYAASKFSIMSDLYILLGGGAELDPIDISGLSPLHLAARLGNESLVRILIERGANPTLKDMYNFTPYDHAKENKHASIMKRLQDYMVEYSDKRGLPVENQTESENSKTYNNSVPAALSRELMDLKELAINRLSVEEVMGPINSGMKDTERIRNVETETLGFQRRKQRMSIVW